MQSPVMRVILCAARNFCHPSHALPSSSPSAITLCSSKWAYRRMFKISWTMKMTNQLKKACLLVDIRKKEMGYFGHIIRHSSTIQHALLEREIEDRRSRGRPITMWMGNIEWSGYGYVEATRKAQDRNYWRQLIASDPAMDGT